MLLLLRYDSRTVKQPIISRTTLKTGALINILKAEVGARKGEIVIEVSDEKARDVEKVLKEMGVEVVELTGTVVKDDSKCIHCGLCISICPTEVFRFDEDMKVVADVEKCIHCGTCVRVCPTNALSLPT